MESSGLCGMHFTKERGEEGGNPIHFRLPARWVLFHESMSWLCLGRDTVERVQQRCYPCIPSSGPGLNGCCWTTTVAALLGDVSTPAPCFSFLLWP